jgi:hypothetical protein
MIHSRGNKKRLLILFRPFLGGVLAHPADRWHDTLGTIQFLKNYPYFLPCFAAGIVPILCFLLALVGLKEASCHVQYAVLVLIAMSM